MNMDIHSLAFIFWADSMWVWHIGSAVEQSEVCDEGGENMTHC